MLKPAEKVTAFLIAMASSNTSLYMGAQRIVYKTGHKSIAHKLLLLPSIKPGVTSSAVSALLIAKGKPASNEELEKWYSNPDALQLELKAAVKHNGRS